MKYFAAISRRFRTMFSFFKILSILRSPLKKSAPPKSSDTDHGPSPDSIRHHEGEVIGQYKLISELDRGTFAAVYHCKHTCTQRSYAAKYYSLEWVQTSKYGMNIVDKELHVMKLLNHHNAVFLQDVVFTKDCILVVMELVPGKTLVDILPTEGGLVESFARQIFVQFLDGLQYLHRNRIVHQDIKLENVMIDFAGNVKIIDYGMAKHIPRRNSMTQDLLVTERCGTRNYLAPEIYDSEESQLRGDLTDIWASGVLLFTLVVGTFPFYHDDDAEKEKKVLNCESWIDNWLKADRSISPELRDLFREIFVKSPGKRPSVAALKDHPWTKGTKLSKKEEQGDHFTGSSGKVSVYLLERKVQRSISCDFTSFCSSASRLSTREAPCKGSKIHMSFSSPHIQLHSQDANNVAEFHETKHVSSESDQSRRCKLGSMLHSVYEAPKRICLKLRSKRDSSKKDKRLRNQYAQGHQSGGPKRANLTMAEDVRSRVMTDTKRRKRGTRRLSRTRDSLLTIGTTRR